MPAKQKAAPGKKKKRVPVDHLIEVNADIHGNFEYLVNGAAGGASIRPHVGDTISWKATLMHLPISFQVEFSGFGPFGPGNQVVRSLFQKTKPLTVTVPKYYHGNLVFKYTVTLGNGWSDDPDIVPVPSQLLGDVAQVISLSIDNNTGMLLVDPSDAQFVKGEVSWEWAGTPLDDFSVTFDKTVSGWPPAASSEAKKITLDLETAGYSTYTIQTSNLGLSSLGNKLTIT